MTKELAKTELTFKSVAPSYIDLSATRGSEEVTSKDMVLPRLEIVQPMSPIKQTNREVRDGELYSTLSNTVLGEKIFFVPVYYRMEYLLWKNRDVGGGFLGTFPTEEAAKARIRIIAHADECKETDVQVVDTPIHIGLMIRPDGSTEQLVISMPKTKAAVSRKWNAMIQCVTGDRFARVYRLSTFLDSNKKGDKFYNFAVQPVGFTPEEVYKKAEQLYNIIKAQTVVVSHEQEQEPTFERGEI